MKLKILGLALTYLLSNKLLAQVSIQSNQLAGPNDSFIYQLINPDLAPNPFEGSENHVWDFSGLNFIDQENFAYISSNRTPYRNYFFNSFGNKLMDSLGFGEFSIQNVYQFYQKNTTAYVAMGLGFGLSLIPLPLAGQYTDRDIIYKLPIKYPDYYQDSFDLLIPVLNFGFYKQTGYRINDVNGFGLIKTDLGYFPVLRIVSEIVQTDSLIINGVGFGIPNNRIEIKFLSPNFKVPVVEYTINSILGNPIVSEVKILNQQLRTSNLSKDELSSNPLKIYPNPAKEFVIISNSLAGKISYQIFDITGKLMESRIIENQEIIDLKNYDAGIYTIRYKTENQEIFTEKLIIK